MPITEDCIYLSVFNHLSVVLCFSVIKSYLNLKIRERENSDHALLKSNRRAIRKTAKQIYFDRYIICIEYKIIVFVISSMQIQNNHVLICNHKIYLRAWQSKKVYQSKTSFIFLASGPSQKPIKVTSTFNHTSKRQLAEWNALHKKYTFIWTMNKVDTKSVQRTLSDPEKYHARLSIRERGWFKIHLMYKGFLNI